MEECVKMLMATISRWQKISYLFIPFYFPNFFTMSSYDVHVSTHNRDL